MLSCRIALPCHEDVRAVSVFLGDNIVAHEVDEFAGGIFHAEEQFELGFGVENRGEHADSLADRKSVV